MAYKSLYPIGEVPLNRICYDYRDDIAFRIYVMMTNDWDSMKIWKRLKHGAKAKKHGSYKPKYLKKLLKWVKDTPAADDKTAWEKITKVGRIKDRVHFAFDKKRKVYYPAGGGSRVAIAYFLCYSHVPALLISTEQGAAWRKNYGVGSRHFRGMPEHIIEKMLFRRRINNLFVKGIVKGRVRKEFLYKIPDLGFRGKCDSNDLLNNKDFLDKIKGKKILNFIQDNGYLEVCLADHCSFVTTVGNCSCYIKISSTIADYYKKDNIKHTDSVLSDLEYDIILSRKLEDLSNYTKLDKNIIFKNNGKVFLGYRN